MNCKLVMKVFSYFLQNKPSVNMQGKFQSQFDCFNAIIESTVRVWLPFGTKICGDVLFPGTAVTPIL